MKKTILNIMLVLSFIGTFIVFPCLVLDIENGLINCQKIVEEINKNGR